MRSVSEVNQIDLTILSSILYNIFSISTCFVSKGMAKWFWINSQTLISQSYSNKVTKWPLKIKIEKNVPYNKSLGNSWAKHHFGISLMKSWPIATPSTPHSHAHIIFVEGDVIRALSYHFIYKQENLELLIAAGRMWVKPSHEINTQPTLSPRPIATIQTDRSFYDSVNKHT